MTIVLFAKLALIPFGSKGPLKTRYQKNTNVAINEAVATIIHQGV